ncbi:hypothetical protein [Vibrio phage RYC]|nr:hypothetical protein [Vibrio phage RYC]
MKTLIKSYNGIQITSRALARQVAKQIVEDGKAVKAKDYSISAELKGADRWRVEVETVAEQVPAKAPETRRETLSVTRKPSGVNKLYKRQPDCKTPVKSSQLRNHISKAISVYSKRTKI